MPSYGKLCFLLSGTISGLASFLMFLNSHYVAKWISGGEAEETSRVLSLAHPGPPASPRLVDVFFQLLVC